jgi:ArsR family transcriptional regulator, arsenate/arsenite/antimonite-responsive transcriptional repressor
MKSTYSKPNADLAFRAFSDRTRLRILHLLLDGELCVGDLVKILKTPQPTASRHLAYLRKARLVTTRNRGPWTFYALATAKSPFHKMLLACLGQCFTEVNEMASDTARVKKIKRSGGCCPL